MTVGIVTDSTCDLPQSIIEALGIIVVPMYINIGEQSYQDGVDLLRQDFYRQLPDYETFPVTAAPGVGKFQIAYHELARRGASEILSIHISRSLSAVVNAARLASEKIDSVPITVFDAGQLSLGTGFAVELAARLARQGLSVAGILPRLEDQGARTHVFAALDTLEFLRRSGRMNGAMAGLGSLLSIKPILTMHNGVPGSIRVRTRDKAIDRVLQMLADCAPLERVALVHTHAPEQATEELRQQAQVWLPPGEILSMDITPVIGAHIGPGAVGFACISKK